MKRHQADLLAVLALFCVYAATALLLSAIGASVYRDAVGQMQTNYDGRTSSLYVAEKVRQSDVNGAVGIRLLDGGDALVLVEQQSGERYETWIYVHEGMLCETLISSGAKVDYRLGQEIMPMQTMRLAQFEQGNGSLLEVRFTMPDGSTSAIDLFLKSKAGES
ncbi:MAG: DUF4860 domain-containing protein [Coriobacteriales bacterium]|jgi:hypothetical protein|nr:DUF4860 domain-containing protein [Coriobacteriales bacterium]